MFKPVLSRVSFPQMEESILSLWKKIDVFQKSINTREGKTRFVFYEGPPFANGNPGIHHVLARAYKDIIIRYKVMKGFYVPRSAGWDAHGLPVELEIEKQLGFSGKDQIEKYGVEEFNKRCRESVFKYLKEWNSLTERIAYWGDLEHAYKTMDNTYIESVWWALKQMWDKGLVYQGYRVTPHCPRCGTSLSSHEVAPGTEYVLLEGLNDYLILAKWTYAALLLDRINKTKEAKGIELIGYNEKKTMLGDELVGVKYQPLYDVPIVYYANTDKSAYRVIEGDFVTMEEGTGIVHIAPAYGEIDFTVGEKEGLPLVHTVDLDGKIKINTPRAFTPEIRKRLKPGLSTSGFPEGLTPDTISKALGGKANIVNEQGKNDEVLPGAGKFVKDADKDIIEDLKSRDLLLSSGTVTHIYPFCWRCDAPLLYYAKETWYIKTTAIKDRLIAGNEEINWYPAHIKKGRFGNWLENNVDWGWARERYWG